LKAIEEEKKNLQVGKAIEEEKKNKGR